MDVWPIPDYECHSPPLRLRDLMSESQLQLVLHGPPAPPLPPPREFLDWATFGVIPQMRRLEAALLAHPDPLGVLLFVAAIVGGVWSGIVRPLP